MEKETGESAEDLFQRGVRLAERGDLLSALSFIERACEYIDTPVCRSYLGMLKAFERGQITEGIAVCNTAIDDEPENPQLYLNLGKILYKAEMKKEAIDAVRRGLANGPHEPSKRWLDALGIRRKPVFPFLSRNNFLNKYAGLLMKKLEK